ncbi:sensor histidine kinase [Roseibium litorale]|uniref:histidine kinase n=1 Tax=Roseibium litorale TaxID=2803841 RepID=A0ABR9CSD1_9HYPH|nr:HAMP domain-containing sensor histidine kinase [Roseibium litorale]MBD8893549.1 HAMP domain-containing histidine kinase [Roseibium litorale]
MKGRSLRLRLLLAGAVSTVLALALSAAGLTLLFSRHVEQREEAELFILLDQLAGNVDWDPATGALTLARPPSDPRFDTPLSGRYWQVEAGGKTLRSRSLWDGVMPMPEDSLNDGALHRHTGKGPAGEDLLILERGITLPARMGSAEAEVAAAVSLADVQAASQEFAISLMPYLALLTLFLTGAAYVQVTVGLSPLRRIRTALQAIHSSPSERLGDDFPAEIQPIASEVDALLAAREEQIGKARARAADLAHGLKTPLQVLSGDVARLRALGQEEVAHDLETLADGMRRHVDRELARARMAAASNTARADVKEAALKVVSVIQRTPQGKALSWTTELPDALLAAIDPDDLSEILGNLIENASRHAGTRIKVSAAHSSDRIALSIEDDGPGIAPGKLDQILRRGGRLDETPGGTGLGLAIVQDILDAWDGSLDITSSEDGTCAKVGLRRG